MINTKNVVFFLMIGDLMTIAISCSTSKSPIAPSVDRIPDRTNLPETNIDTHSRVPMAVYEAVIDLKSETFMVTLVTRETQYHFPFTNLYPDCLQITGFGFTPNFRADIKLKHPLPGSGGDVFKPRVIEIVPVHAESYFHYPSLYAYVNNAIINEPIAIPGSLMS